jgi:hypothetical protein
LKRVSPGPRAHNVRTLRVEWCEAVIFLPLNPVVQSGSALTAGLRYRTGLRFVLRRRLARLSKTTCQGQSGVEQRSVGDGDKWSRTRWNRDTVKKSGALERAKNGGVAELKVRIPTGQIVRKLNGVDEVLPGQRLYIFGRCIPSRARRDYIVGEWW